MLAGWSSGDGLSHSSVNLYENGKVGYMSRVSASHENTITLFKGMCSWAVTPSTDVGDDLADESTIPKEFDLLPGYPNPFNPSTTITYVLPRTANVQIAIFDIPDRQVKILTKRAQVRGKHSVQWDATDARGQQVASGLYFCRMQAEGMVLLQKLLFTK